MSQWWLGFNWGMLLALVLHFVGKFSREAWDAQQPKKFKVWVVWGSPTTIAERGQAAISEYAFATQAELLAFMLGLSDHDGWCDFHTADTRELAEEYVEQFNPESGKAKA